MIGPIDASVGTSYYLNDDLPMKGEKGFLDLRFVGLANREDGCM
jgi:hypothetical protein